MSEDAYERGWEDAIAHRAMDLAYMKAHPDQSERYSRGFHGGRRIRHE